MHHSDTRSALSLLLFFLISRTGSDLSKNWHPVIRTRKVLRYNQLTMIKLLTGLKDVSKHLICIEYIGESTA